MTILDTMITRAHDRRDHWHTVEMQELPPVEFFHQTAIVGAFSLVLMSDRMRILNDPLCLSIDHCRETPSAVARDYLTLRYTRGPLIKHEQYDTLKARFQAPPLLAIPTDFTSGHGWYIDIQAAYWSIMANVGWNVDYWPGRWIREGQPPADFPFADHKLARNCLVSAGISTEVPMYKPPDEYFQVHRGNHLSNVGLFRLITDVLHCIAGEAKRAGAIYVNTDGFIVDNLLSKERVEHIIQEWGLTSRVCAEGPGMVQASGAYKVGSRISGLLDISREGLPLDHVWPPKYRGWLKDRFLK